MDDTSMADPGHIITQHTTTPTTEADSSSHRDTLCRRDDFHAATRLLRLTSLDTLSIVNIQCALTTA